MILKKRLILALAIAIIPLAVIFFRLTTTPPRPHNDKRLLEFGWNTPRLQAMLQFIDAAQQTPFDGLILDVETPRHDAGLSWTIFQDERIDASAMETLSRNMSGFRWGKLTDNFLRVNVSPGTVDWFDDFEGVLFNLETVARLAYDLGFQGLMLDTEQYPGVDLFYYPEQDYNERYSFQEYADQVHRRGREVMQVLNRGYPGITILYAYGLAVAPYEDFDELEDHPYGLLVPFIEGMAAAADDETTLINGFEQSYTYRRDEQFRSAFEFVRGFSFNNKPTEAQQGHLPLQIGFGLWVDHRCDNGDPQTTCLGFTPDEFQQGVQLVLKYSDRYVWVYSQRFNWYTGEGIPPDWREALVQLRN